MKKRVEEEEGKKNRDTANCALRDDNRGFRATIAREPILAERCFRLFPPTSAESLVRALRNDFHFVIPRFLQTRGNFNKFILGSNELDVAAKKYPRENPI